MSKPIIVAVDETQPSSFKRTVESLDSKLCMIKVGSVSFNTAAAPSAKPAIGPYIG